jgi:hypothetical protein
MCAREIGIPRIAVVANKTRDDEDRRPIGEIPMDDRLRKADLAGRAPIDETDSPAIAASRSLADSLRQPS